MKGRSLKLEVVGKRVLSGVVAAVVCWYTGPARAELEKTIDLAGKAQDQAVNAYIQRFVKFTQNKDVQGRMSSPDGKVQLKRPKANFNPDDGGLFQSDLTYHTQVKNDIEETQTGKKGPDGKAETQEKVLFAFVSPHGKFSGAGGSSALERAAYQEHQKFSKLEEADKDKKDDDKTGTKFRDMFKIQTQEVFNDKNGNGQGQGGQGQGGQGQNKNNKQEKDKVERFTIREESRPAIDKVGEDSFKNEVARAAKDQGKEDDPNALPNMTFLYEAAGRAAQSMWNSTLAKLAERRIFKAIKPGALGETPSLWEETPTVQAWQQKVNGAIAKAAQGDQQLQKALQADTQRMAKQANQIAGLRWDKIDPRFEAPKNGGQQGGGQGGQQGGAQGANGDEQLVFKGPAKEDPFQRDMRVQLSVLDKAGTDPNKIPSNWKYDAKDSQATLNNYDNSGNESGTRQVTVQQQLDSYNQQLQDAAKGMQEVQARFPDYKPNIQATLGYQIAPGTRSVMDIDRPTESMMEEFGVGQRPAPQMAQDFNTLNKTQGQPR